MRPIPVLAAFVTLAAPVVGHASAVTHGQPVAMVATTFNGLDTSVNPADMANRTSNLDTTNSGADFGQSGGWLGQDSFSYSFDDNALTITLTLGGAAFAAANQATHHWFQFALLDSGTEFSGLTEVSDSFVGTVGGADGFVTSTFSQLLPGGGTRWSGISFSLEMAAAALTPAVREAGTTFTAVYEFGLNSLVPSTPPGPLPVSAPGSAALAGLALLVLAATRRLRR